MENINIETEYRQFATECECAMRFVLASIENLKSEYDLMGEKTPFSSVSSRIKTLESVLEKCDRKFEGAATPETLHAMHDIAGVRIVTNFEDDIYKVSEVLRHRPEFSIENVKDYVANPKPNGYRSLHMIALVTIRFMGVTKVVPVEIQVRDKAMDQWASIEHEINYKFADAPPEIAASFKRIADFLAQADQVAMELRETALQLREADSTES